MHFYTSSAQKGWHLAKLQHPQLIARYSATRRDVLTSQGFREGFPTVNIAQKNNNNAEMIVRDLLAASYIRILYLYYVHSGSLDLHTFAVVVGGQNRKNCRYSRVPSYCDYRVSKCCTLLRCTRCTRCRRLWNCAVVRVQQAQLIDCAFTEKRALWPYAYYIVMCAVQHLHMCHF